MKITVDHLKTWLNSLPPEAGPLEVESCVMNNPSAAARIIYYGDSSGHKGVLICSAGTHLNEKFMKRITILSSLEPK